MNLFASSFTRNYKLFREFYSYYHLKRLRSRLPYWFGSYFALLSLELLVGSPVCLVFSRIPPARPFSSRDGHSARRILGHFFRGVHLYYFRYLSSVLLLSIVYFDASTTVSCISRFLALLPMRFHFSFLR